MIRFADVFLSKAELAILEDLSSGKVGIFHPVEVERLMSYGLIDVYPLGATDKEYVIQGRGLDYLEYKHTVEKENKETRTHLRVTTVISIIGVILAVTSLILQLLK